MNLCRMAQYEQNKSCEHATEDEETPTKRAPLLPTQKEANYAYLERKTKNNNKRGPPNQWSECEPLVSTPGFN